MTAYDQSPCARERLAGDLEVALVNAGFAATGEVGEICYAREHNKSKNVFVRVYTTIPQGSNMVRDVGQDAIRVCATYSFRNKRRGLIKESRVYRCGEIEEIIKRTIQRARNVWAQVNQIPKCKKCGALTFESKAGNRVCANLCWTREGNG